MDSTGVKTNLPFEGTLDQHAFKMLFAAVMLLLGTATVVYRFVEDWSWVDSFYFSTVAVTTVGFGDLAPSTDGSKLFTVFYVIAGIALIATYLNVSLRRASARIAHRRH